MAAGIYRKQITECPKCGKTANGSKMAWSCSNCHAIGGIAPQNQPELKLKKGTRSFEETLRLVEEVEEQTKGEYFVKHNCNCPKEEDCRAILELHTLSKPVEELPGEVQYIKHCRTCICK